MLYLSTYIALLLTMHIAVGTEIAEDNGVRANRLAFG
jgi:hypothetical protein